MKSFFYIFSMILFFSGLSFNLINNLNAKDEDENNKGQRGLKLEERMNAENRYSNFLKSFKANKEDISIFKNDIFYIENGYYDYGFVPKYTDNQYGSLPDSYWVFVYPNWYLWKNQSLDLRR